MKDNKREGIISKFNFNFGIGAKSEGGVALLEKDGYLIMNDDKTLELTQKGKDVADKMFERHSFFVKWLESLGVSPEIAEEEGCAIEHNVSDDTFNKIKNAYGNQIKN